MDSPTDDDALREKAHAVADRTTAAIDGARETASGASAEAVDHASAAADAAGGVYARGAQGVRNAIDEVPANVSDAMAVGERLVLRGRQRLDHGVRKQPVEALLLAGALGYLLGWATARG